MESAPWEQLFESEAAAVDETEDDGAYAADGENAPYTAAGLFPEQQAQHDEARALPDVAEHDAEKQRVGEREEKARVALAVGGQAVHLQNGVKDGGEAPLFEAHRRGMLRIAAAHTAEAGLGLYLRRKGVSLAAVHPADEIEASLGKPRIAPRGKAAALEFEEAAAAQKLAAAFVKQLLLRLVQRGQLVGGVPVGGAKLVERLCGRPLAQRDDGRGDALKGIAR